MVRNSFRSGRETRRRARDAVDSEKAKTARSEAADEDGESDAEAAAARRETAAEETAEIAESAASAPSFTLPGYHDGGVSEFTLDGFLQDGALLLGTYPFDFTDICTSMMCQLQDMDWFEYKRNLSLVGVSRDSPFAHEVFAEREDIGFPLLSDVDGELIRDYDLVEPKLRGVPNVPKRAILLVDREGTVRYRWVADDAEDEWQNNPVEEAIGVLNQL